ncbi:MAG: hypothetical protein U5R31_17375 [Acidimicrobiia bacterium]|nr:hypothetical protein [Acidimicrobiia bacterium]
MRVRHRRRPALRDAIARSAAPAAVELAVDRLAGAHPGLEDELEIHTGLRDAVVAVTAASRSLTRTLEADAEAVEVLRDIDRRHEVSTEDPDALVASKHLELLRIAARDLLGVDDLARTTGLLSYLAADVLDGSCALATDDGLAVIGMGKLGADELNYASDIDIIFVGDGEPTDLDRSAREVMELARRCYRVDANLRPEGRAGQLVRTIDSYEAYWDRWAEPWEFQALIKARPVAGDRHLGRRFTDTAQRWLWNRPFDADDLRAVRALKERSEADGREEGTPGPRT